MDVNGTRFHLLLGEPDWAARAVTLDGTRLSSAFEQSKNAGDAPFSWDDRRNELTLGTRAFFFEASKGDRRAELDARRGAAADLYGNIFWIAADGLSILVNSAGSRQTTTFWPRPRPAAPPFSDPPQKTFASCTAGVPRPVALAGLAVTTLHYLVAGTTDPAGLLVFDLQSGGEPRQFLWPAGVDFAPFDLAAAPDGGAWLLDRGHKRLWRFDRTFGVVALGPVASATPFDAFMSMDGTPAHRGQQPAAITLGHSLLLTAADPVAVESLPDGSFLLIDSPAGTSFSTIRRFRGNIEVASRTTEGAKALIEEGKRSKFRLLGHDFVYLERRTTSSDPLERILYIAGDDGDQAVAFRIAFDGDRLDLTPLAEFYPLRLFGAKALIAGAGQALYDAQDRWVPLVPQKRGRFAGQATLLIRGLDGKDPDCVWHRLMLDACIPPECDVAVSTRASNDLPMLDFLDWHEEPDLLRRRTGSELAWSNDTRGAGVDTWELLFQTAKGRYLDLRLTLSGTGRSTPRIRALRAWYPRFSYLDHYLPAIYRENAESASFLDRFLANTEGFFTNIEDRIAAVQCLLDVRCAPAETLEWLAGWFGVALDPAWDEARRRLFLRHAADFFEWRGTVPGLQMALRLVTESCADDSIFTVDPARRTSVRIIERFRSRLTPGLVFSNVSDGAGLPLRQQQSRWTPALGADDLDRRWSEYLASAGSAVDAAAGPQRYPIVPIDRHGESQRYVQWATFSRDTLGFVPRASSDDLALWSDSLQRRYPSLKHLNDAWGTAYPSWNSVPLFTELPRREAALRDWAHFEGIVLAARDSAHRFTVFLPQGTLGLRDREQRLDLARRVIALEKPAHTTFEVKFYWAFFRIGEARLGDDTVVDLGGRSPEFLSPFVLDRNYLGSGWLASEQAGCSSSNCGCPSTRGGDQ